MLKKVVFIVLILFFQIKVAFCSEESTNNVIHQYIGVEVKEIQCLDKTTGQNTPRILIENIIKNGPASKGRIRKGYILYKIGDSECTDLNSYNYILAHQKIGNAVDIELLRVKQSETNGRKTYVVISRVDDELDAHRISIGINPVLESFLGNDTNIRQYIGMEVKNIAYFPHFGNKINKGIFITSIITKSPAFQSGMKEGALICDINGEKCETTNEFQNILQKYRIGEMLNINTIQLETKLVNNKPQYCTPGEMDTDIWKVTVGLNPIWEECVGQVQSKLIHAIYCNHLPEGQNAKYFPDTVSAELEGYKYCKICYGGILEGKGISELEWTLGEKSIDKIESRYTVVKSGPLYERIKSIADKIASKSERGNFKIDVKILETRTINAFACPPCPNATIFITSGLLDILESEDEIAGVLSHELAHIDNKHGLKTFLYIKQQETNKAIIAVAATAIAIYAGVKGNIAVSSLAGAISGFDLFYILSSYGYSRELEGEADVLALGYLSRSGYNPKSYLIFLGKIKDYELYMTNRESGTLFSTHPKTDDRIRAVKNKLDDKILK